MYIFLLKMFMNCVTEQLSDNLVLFSFYFCLEMSPFVVFPFNVDTLKK